MPIDPLAQSAALFCPYQWYEFQAQAIVNRPSVFVLDISPPQEGN